MNKIILILGNGYIGGYLGKALKEVSDFDVRVYSKKLLDYTCRETLDFLLSENRKSISHVIGAFGYTGRPNVDGCEDNKEDCWSLNVTVPTMVNSLCRNYNIPYIHISSGCIYDGYVKDWEEDDVPNYGLFNENSSFYSKTKHAYELQNSDYGLTVRIRMPFDDELSDRSITGKLWKYSNLIDKLNSKTYIPNLCDFIEQYILEERKDNDVINFVNPDPLTTSQVVDILSSNGIYNTNWKWVEFEELGTKTGRSNCTLSTQKLITKYNYTPMSEADALERSLAYYTF